MFCDGPEAVNQSYVNPCTMKPCVGQVWRYIISSPFRLAVASAFAPRLEVDAAARRKGWTIGATVADRLTWSAVSGPPVPFAELEPRLFDFRGSRFRFGFNLLFELPTRFACLSREGA